MNKLELYIQGMQDLKEAILDQKFINDNYGCEDPTDAVNVLERFKPEKIVKDHKEYHKKCDDSILKDDLIITDRDIWTACGVTKCSVKNDILKTKREILDSIHLWHTLVMDGQKNVSERVADRKAAAELLNKLTPEEVEKHKGIDLRIFLTRWKSELRMAISKLPEKQDDGI